MKKVLIFGSTGSIGRNALEIIRRDKNNFSVLGLLVNKNIELLNRQIREFHPPYVCVVDEAKAKEIRNDLPKKVKLFYGKNGVREFSQLSSDISLMAIVGISSLEPFAINVKRTKRMALVSKEVLVVAGKLWEKFIKDNSVEIIPVDSEINALFQLLRFVDKNQVKKIYLTASGGALLNYNKRELEKITVREVLSHPTWGMGERITVDSSTLVNKGFEVMETHYLFGIDYPNIDVVIHRESSAHAFLEMKDNILFGCFYVPDMKIPLSFSLYYPKRFLPIKGLDFSFQSKNLSFKQVRRKDFPLLDIVLSSARIGENFPIVVNAADEVAINYFLKGRIKFLHIHRAIENIFNSTKKHKVRSLDDIFFWDDWARLKTEEFLKKLLVN
ncbi:MAG: 1-deoxy-D-xylulose-5-phosphate reductoisomerase [Candidatus Omnitrophica bacterium]|nr:1-deoxy-D-xylulose-5-phosphate reductoisomerase [Candidatus Omnitrophota bacterium]